ncbi:hypothetical protein CDAR_237131 [Caerostris darwini]|uniref:Uncharacterized protein n=1 Tax=Caerostris darwini TaxID=1538125 RepID=A0AAV4W0M2_9ARAC|nr:hypothetical protein CDAR_237131 [Caerostris darwini]
MKLSFPIFQHSTASSNLMAFQFLFTAPFRTINSHCLKLPENPNSAPNHNKGYTQFTVSGHLGFESALSWKRFPLHRRIIISRRQEKSRLLGITGCQHSPVHH